MFCCFDILKVVANRVPNSAPSLRIEYKEKNQFKVIAKRLGIMEDFKVREDITCHS